MKRLILFFSVFLFWAVIACVHTVNPDGSSSTVIDAKGTVDVINATGDLIETIDNSTIGE